MFLARDENFEIFLHEERPERVIECVQPSQGFFHSNGLVCWIHKEFFPEVIWENSPVEVVIK